MTNDDRIKALETFGYDHEEAHFLVLVALHSGYFLRRQYLSFVKGTNGWRDESLLKKLTVRGHGEVSVLRHNRQVCHLGAKPLYDAIGERENRNRRERQPSTIKNKLMGLDFVLENTVHHYLATEQERLEYFLITLTIAEENLPTRWYTSPHGRGATAKHFVDKYPLFLATPVGNRERVPHFCYVDEGMQSTDRFATHLAQYGPLLNALSDFRVIYIAQHPGLFPSAERVFAKFWNERNGAGNAPDFDPETRDLLAHFETRQDYEAQHFTGFDTARLIAFREARKRFSGERYDRLYRLWQSGGARAVRAALHSNPPADTPESRFSTYTLQHNYDLFGTLIARGKGRAEQTGNRSEVRNQARTEP